MGRTKIQGFLGCILIAPGWLVEFFFLTPFVVAVLILICIPDGWHRERFETIVVVAVILINVFFLLWLWVIGRYFSTRVGAESVKRFLSYFNIAIGCLLVFLTIFALIVVFKSAARLQLLIPAVLMDLVIVFAQFCIVFVNGYVASLIIKLELETDGLVTEGLFFTFLALCFYPFGIYSIQPRLNALHKKLALI